MNSMEALFQLYQSWDSGELYPRRRAAFWRAFWTGLKSTDRDFHHFIKPHYVARDVHEAEEA